MPMRQSFFNKKSSAIALVKDSFELYVSSQVVFMVSVCSFVFSSCLSLFHFVVFITGRLKMQDLENAGPGK